jgi:hypothetical protein
MTFIHYSFFGKEKWVMKKIFNCLKNPLSNANDFIHDFLLIPNKLSCLLTSEIAKPPSSPYPTSVIFL